MAARLRDPSRSRSRSRSRSSSPPHRRRSPPGSRGGGRGNARRRERSPSPGFRRGGRGGSPGRGRAFSPNQKKAKGSRDALFAGPLVSYKQFLYQMDRAHSAAAEAEYGQYLQTYKDNRARIFFDAHKNEPWVNERYHPTEMERRFADRLKGTALRAQQFHAKEAVEMDAVRQRTLCVSKIPRTMSTAQLAQLVGSDVVELLVNTPQPTADYLRTAYVECADAAQLARVQGALQGHSWTEASQTHTLEVVVAATPAPVTMPAIVLKRQERDVELATQLAVQLDVEASVRLEHNAAAQLARLGSASAPQRLLCLTRYLLRVHLYSYYGWRQYGSVGEVAALCPEFVEPAEETPAAAAPVAVAPAAAAVQGDDEALAEGAADAAADAAAAAAVAATAADAAAAAVKAGERWAEDLEYHVRRRFERPPVRDEESGRLEVDRQLEALMAHQCKPDTEGRYRCASCNKLFMTQDFVRKHIHNKHLDLIEQSRLKALDEQCFRNFLADPDHLTSLSGEPALADMGSVVVTSGAAGETHARSPESPPRERERDRRDGDRDRDRDRDDWRRKTSGGRGGRSGGRDRDPRDRGDDRRHGRERPRGPPPPIPENVRHDPREVRAYVDLDNLRTAPVEDEIDYRLI